MVRLAEEDGHEVHALPSYTSKTIALIRRLNTAGTSKSFHLHAM